MRRLKYWLFSMLGKDPEAVIVSFASGSAKQARTMVEEIKRLEPGRRHFLVSVGPANPIDGVSSVCLDPSGPWGLLRQLRRRLGRYRIGLAPVLFSGPGHPLRLAAFLLAPSKILAYNSRLERHHLRLRTCIASWLFLKGVPLDRIFLRPSWLVPWKRDRSRPSRQYRIIDGVSASAHRHKIGILSPYFPYPLSHGGAVRIFHLLREAAREFDVHLFAFGEPPAEEDLEPVRRLACRIVLMELPRYREPRWVSLLPPEVREFKSPVLRRLIAEARRDFGIELLQVEYTHLASYGGDILVEHDVTWDLHAQVHAKERSLSSWWDLCRWKHFEQRAVSRYRRVVAMSSKDERLLAAPHARVIPNGVDLERFQPVPESDGRNLLFVGSFRHFPNILAFRFLWEEVWPILVRIRPDTTLTVVAGPDPLVYWKAATDARPPESGGPLRLHGFVRDVKPLYDQANVVVVPTPVSAGTNLKVLEAMAMRRAVVSTTCGCQGLMLEHGSSAWISDDAAGFAEGISRLLADRPLREEMARQACEIARRDFDWRSLGIRQSALWRELLPERIRVRAATVADVEMVRRIQESSPKAAQWDPAAYVNYQFHVAECDGQPAGFIVWRHTAPGETEIMNIAVDPQFRRRGIAMRLLDFARDRCPGRIFLEVRVSNQPAIELYQKAGFRITGTRKQYYSCPPEDAIVMAL